MSTKNENITNLNSSKALETLKTIAVSNATTESVEKTIPESVATKTSNVKGSDLNAGDTVLLPNGVKGIVYEAPTSKTWGSLRIPSEGRFIRMYASFTYVKVILEHE